MTTPTLDVRQISPEVIAPDPDNPRGKLRDIDDLAASVATHGVLDPITVRPDLSANGSGPKWIVVRGHRRHAAALQAKVELMPCIVDFHGDAKSRAAQRLVENLQRDDLTPAEHAKGVQQLLDLGISEEEVAAQLSVKPAQVASARAISTSKVLAKAPKTLELTFDQAAAVAEFEDSPNLGKALLTTLKDRPGMFDHVLERHRRERDQATAITTKEAELKAQGYKILPGSPHTSQGKAAPLSTLKASKEAKGNLTKATHAKCPGRGAWVRTDYNGKILVAEGCLDPKANGHASSVATRAGAPTAKRTAAKKPDPKAESAKAIAAACEEASAAAMAVRRRFVAELLGRAAPPKGTMAYVVPLVVGQDTYLDHATFAELLGHNRPKARRVGEPTAVDRWIAGLKEAQLPLALLGFVAASAEWDPKDWDSKWDVDERKAYLRFLVTCGYTPSTVEKVALGEAKPGDVLAEAEKLKAAAKA